MTEESINMSRKTRIELIDEAAEIAHQINMRRFAKGEITAEMTVRLIEIMDILTDRTRDVENLEEIES